MARSRALLLMTSPMSGTFPQAERRGQHGAMQSAGSAHVVEHLSRDGGKSGDRERVADALWRVNATPGHAQPPQDALYAHISHGHDRSQIAFDAEFEHSRDDLECRLRQAGRGFLGHSVDIKREAAAFPD